MLVMIGTDWIGSYKSNCHTIKTMSASERTIGIVFIIKEQLILGKLKYPDENQHRKGLILFCVVFLQVVFICIVFILGSSWS